MRSASVLLTVALASCGIPVKESFWRPEATNGYLLNSTTCDLGNRNYLVVPLDGGVRIETAARTEEGTFVARYSLHGTIKGKPIATTASIQGELGLMEVPLTPIESKDTLVPTYEVRWPTLVGATVVVILPSFEVGGAQIATIPPITYKYDSRPVLKCIHF